jgi:hypothetical protein
VTPIETRNTNCELFGGNGIDPLPILRGTYAGSGYEVMESCWRPTFREWVTVLFRRRVYLQCLGTRHPAVHVGAKSDAYLMATTPEEVSGV